MKYVIAEFMIPPHLRKIAEGTMLQKVKVAARKKYNKQRGNPTLLYTYDANNVQVGDAQQIIL